MPICRVSKDRVYRNKSAKCCRAEKRIHAAEQRYSKAFRRAVPTPYSAPKNTKAMASAEKAYHAAVSAAARMGC